MHKIAKTAAVTFSILILTAASLAKIGDGGKLGVQGPTFGNYECQSETS
jgi:hypothetical protein